MKKKKKKKKTRKKVMMTIISVSQERIYIALFMQLTNDVFSFTLFCHAVYVCGSPRFR